MPASGKKSRVLNADERRRAAYHEIGHAQVAATLPGVDAVQKVSIVPRGVGALGYTIQRPTEDRFLLDRGSLENRIAVLMGGRAAEQLVFDGDVSTGAADDLQRAIPENECER
jgi:cell division protease FtsH